MRPLVIYIAGPYSAPDPCINTHRAIAYADVLLQRDLCVPVVPHLSHFWHTMHPHPYGDWIRMDLALLERCDGVIRLAGDSPGADGEVARANELGLPVYSEVFSTPDHDIYPWLDHVRANRWP